MDRVLRDEGPARRAPATGNPLAFTAPILRAWRGARALAPYLVAVAAVAAAGLVRIGLHPLVGDDRPHEIFLLAVLIVSWRCGLGPGLLAGALGAAAASSLFLAPTHPVPLPQQLVGLGLFGGIAVSIAFILERLRNANASSLRQAELARIQRARLEEEIDARREAEDAAREANDRVRKILESVEEGVSALDVDLRYTFVSENAARLLNRPREAILGRTLAEALPGAPSGEFERQVRSALATGMPTRFEHFEASLGRWLESRVYPTPEGATVFARDITERVEAEARIKALNAELERRVQQRTAELSQANRDLESFCYSVSHDLRGPLRTVVASASIVLEDFGKDLNEEGQASLRRIVRAGNNMAQLIDDLLQFSRIGRAEIARQRVDLAKIAEEIAQEMAIRGACKQAAIRIQPGLVAEADPGLTRVALMNLLENACKFSSKSPNPVVEIGKREEGGETVFFVKDNGIGFNPEYSSKLFAPFERLHRAEDYPGTGIGLANVKRVVEKHGGRVWAESREGEGATFFFTL